MAARYFSEMRTGKAANEELIKAHNDDISNKLRAQKEEYDKLLSKKMEAEKILELEDERLKEDTVTVTA